MKNETTVYEKYYEELFEKALEAYKATAESKDLDEKCKKAEERLKERLSEEDYQFAIKETDLFVLNAETEGSFLYKQGFRDCLSILKCFGVL